MNLKPFTLNWSPLFSARSNTLLSEGSIKFELTLPREGEAPPTRGTLSYGCSWTILKMQRRGLSDADREVTFVP